VAEGPLVGSAGVEVIAEVIDEGKAKKAAVLAACFPASFSF